jgi:hypothetical protein
MAALDEQLAEVVEPSRRRAHLGSEELADDE